MKNLIVASEYRKLRLLHTLFKTDQNYQKKELANLLHCSTRTLETDIISLQELFDKNVAHVYEDDTKNIRLDVGEHVNFAYLYALVVSNSYLYSLAKDAFEEKAIHLADWAKEHFVSLPTIYRRVRKIDVYLAESNLVLETSPLAIKGPEINLRFFYYQIYSKSYPYTEWPFPDIPYEIIDTFISQAEAFYHIHFSLSSRIKYAISIAVSLTRAKQGHDFSLPAKDIAIWTEILHSQPEGRTIDYTLLENIFGNTLSSCERYFIAITMFWSHFTHTSGLFLSIRAKTNPEAFLPKYKLAQELVELLNDFHIDDTDLAVRETVDFLARFSFIDKANILPELPPQKMSAEEVTLRDQIRKTLSKYANHPDYRFIRPNLPLIVNRLVEIYSIFIKQKADFDALHVKVISENGYLWEEYLRGEIRRKYSEDQLVICEEKEVHAPKSHIDLIISDFPFYEQPDIEADGLLWNIPPSSTDFAQLDMILERRA
ncbi:hypothetical protein HBP99_07300 [Listeria booriae]|uniref:helix-turn-helix domain-containing protein n=1 Tax=Listeria booriae TaxID=1552123 RepID=UPI00162A719B|nr:helix-turn-helix domain-containing protein [Listeria booriae]MBC1559956.1 hypothetical protein [Listeria booriae]MBC2035073.1 hypothetical protein [Listeria booriae]MBC2368436.1 hypothetical protein [Listeria booriae]